MNKLEVLYKVVSTMKEKEEQRLINLKEIEENLYKEKNLQYICGIDEAGRGP